MRSRRVWAHAHEQLAVDVPESPLTVRTSTTHCTRTPVPSANLHAEASSERAPPSRSEAGIIAIDRLEDGPPPISEGHAGAPAGRPWECRARDASRLGRAFGHARCSGRTRLQFRRRRRAGPRRPPGCSSRTLGRSRRWTAAVDAPACPGRAATPRPGAVSRDVFRLIQHVSIRRVDLPLARERGRRPVASRRRVAFRVDHGTVLHTSAPSAHLEESGAETESGRQRRVALGSDEAPITGSADRSGPLQPVIERQRPPITAIGVLPD